MPKFYAKQTPQKGGLEKGKFVIVDGEKLDLLPQIDTFIYSDVDQDLNGANAPFDVFHIIEVCSGLSLGQGFSLQLAKDRVIETYQNSSPEFVKKMILARISKYGLSPAYRKFIDWPMLEQLIQRKRENDQK